MGVYDTFKTDGVCPSCGEKVTEVQSKAFGCNMETFKIGDIVNTDKEIEYQAVIITERHHYHCDALTKLYIMDNKYVLYFIIKEFIDDSKRIEEHT